MKTHSLQLGLACLALWSAWSSTPARAETVDRIAALVDNDVITLSEIYEIGAPFIEKRCQGVVSSSTCSRTAELEVLDSLILQALIRRELKQLGLDVIPEELDRAVDQVARDAQLDGPDALRVEVERTGVTWETYRDQLGDQLRQMKFQQTVVHPRIIVTEDEIVDQYNRSVRDYRSPPEAVIEAITLPLPAPPTEDSLTETVDAAHSIRKEILSGQLDWKEAIATYHSGRLAGADGHLPPVKPGDLTPALDAAVFDTQPGQISEPVIGAGMVFLFKVLELRQSGVLPLDQVHSKIETQLYEAKVQEETEAWYHQTRRNATVKVLLEDPHPDTTPRPVTASDESIAPAGKVPEPEPPEPLPQSGSSGALPTDTASDASPGDDGLSEDALPPDAPR